MKRTFMLQLPNKIGALLEADRHVANIGLNITRLSYNRVVDKHMLFLEAEGTEDQLEQAYHELDALGFLQAWSTPDSLILFEFDLQDQPGTLLPVLELAAEYRFAIHYVSSYENNSGYQRFQIGLVVDNPSRLGSFISRANQICPTRILDYDRGKRVLDNTKFYLTFADDIAQILNMDQAGRDDVAILSNQILQQLDEHAQGSPSHVFDDVRSCAQAIADHQGSAYDPRVTQLATATGRSVTLIEPPCGSNTSIIEVDGGLLCIDSGLACFTEELSDTLAKLFPNQWKQNPSDLVLTHADIDHSGGASLFDRIYASKPCLDNFEAEREGKPGIRDENRTHAPFINLYKRISAYRPPVRDALLELGKEATHNGDDLLWPIGVFDEGSLHFEVYQGKGGHARGEIVLIERNERLAFTGDIYINVKGQTKAQRQFNANAAYLMTSVDSDPQLAAQERKAVFELLNSISDKEWLVIGGHGAAYIYHG